MKMKVYIKDKKGRRHYRESIIECQALKRKQPRRFEKSLCEVEQYV